MQRWQLQASLLTLGLALWGCSSNPVAPVSAQEAPALSRPHHARETCAALAEDSKGKARKKARNSEFEPIKRDYKELLAKPAELGFACTEELYRNVYFHLRRSFVQEVSEQQLTEALVQELKNYLTQAKISTAPLVELAQAKPGEFYAKAMTALGSKTDPNLLGYVMLNGLLDGLRDNYSVLLTPLEWAKMDEQLNSKSFGGIGIFIELDREAGNQLTVFEPIEGTPAYQAGLLSGDKILKIDGKSTQGVTLDVAQTMIRGLEGSQVLLTVKRDQEVKEVSVTRAKIQGVTATTRMFPGQVGYLRLRAFGEKTGEETAEGLQKLKSQGARSLILDLRNNGGGYISASVDVVGEFAPANSLVVYTTDRQGRRKEYRNQNSGKLNLPAVVLVNEYSASASEITAGALRDHKLATVVGDHSFGKGSVQQLYPLDLADPEHSPRLKLTVARFYTPGGSVIDKQGIEPQVSVDMETKWVGKVEKDVQLQKALELLGGSIK